MAFSTNLFSVLFLSSLLVNAALGEIVCEDLPKDVCAFSIASSGKRCLLETSTKRDGSTEYQCRTSEVVVERMSEYIESDQCVQACGVDRKSVGISSDCLLESNFVSKLCSPACYQNCANIVDLYFNLAAGEGVFLPDLCERQRANPHRSMVELMSSSAASGPAYQDETGAPGPVSSLDSTGAPSPDYQDEIGAPGPDSQDPLVAPGPVSQDSPAISPGPVSEEFTGDDDVEAFAPAPQ